MKNFAIVIACFLLLGSGYGLFGQEIQETKTVQETTLEKVEVYYFHNTRRCSTCMAVESVTKSSLEELYPEQLKSGEIAFASLNIEDDANEALARELNVSGQTLLILKDGKKKDLTNDAFMYATSNPEKLKEKIHKAIGTI